MRSLETIEGQIGHNIEQEHEAILRLSLVEAETVMAFLTETLVEKNGGLLAESPDVKLEFRSDKLVAFAAKVRLSFPLQTTVWARGYIVDGAYGKPHLLNNKVDLSVDQKLARFALYSFGLDKMVKQMLNNIPGAIRETLPERLELLGYKAKIGVILVNFDQGEFVAKIQGSVTKTQVP